jgi:hypothetical protein
MAQHGYEILASSLYDFQARRIYSKPMSPCKRSADSLLIIVVRWNCERMLKFSPFREIFIGEHYKVCSTVEVK